MEFEEFKIMYEAEDTHWWYRGLRGVMFSLLGLNKLDGHTVRILDAGCGTGGTLQSLRSAGFVNTEGFDINEPAIHFCEQRGLNNVRLGSIMEIPFESETFDIVVSNDVLNDVGTTNEILALQELHRVLKPGGRLFLNLPAFNFLRSEHDRATDVARRYTKAQISRMLRAAGFKVKRVTYWNMVLMPVVIAVRIIRRESEEDLSKAARSDIVVPPWPFNQLLTLVVRFERLLLNVMDLPAGSSVAVAATRRKP